MEKLLAILKNIPEFTQLLTSIRRKESAAVTGIGQINRSHMIAALHKEIDRPLAIQYGCSHINIQNIFSRNSHVCKRSKLRIRF